ncbi:hypothetical protein BY996DRAFT_6427095 [Phakopsora pachyrhizi]|nr:hypothetical protein BY996DRAFT_6427095 [Phakopsora pachyrhizi]
MVSFKKTFAAVVLLSAVAAFPTEISSWLNRRTGGGGSYVTSQQDSSQEYTSVTINVVTTRWTELNSLIVGCQNDFTSGQVSATIAQQNIEAIAAQFQQAMLTFDAMDEIEIGETLKGMIKQTFQNFASLIISYQKSFGSQVSDLFKHFETKDKRANKEAILFYNYETGSSNWGEGRKTFL